MEGSFRGKSASVHERFINGDIFMCRTFDSVALKMNKACFHTICNINPRSREHIPFIKTDEQ